MRNPVMLAAWILGAVVALAVVVFVLSNRTPVTVSLSPYPRELDLPLYLVFLAAFSGGALFGGIFVWARAHAGRRVSARRRRRIRALDRELGAAQEEIGTLRAQVRDGAAARPAGVPPATAGAHGPVGETRADV